MKNSVLVTGSFGYLGGHITNSLLLAGFDVRCATRDSTAIPSWASDLAIYYVDWSDQETLFLACKDIHTIIHLASPNEVYCAHNPVDSLYVNAVGSLNLLIAAEKAKVENFIYFSTAHIYGSPLAGFINESTLPKPIHPYALSKRVFEDYLLSFISNNRINGVILRLSNVIGPPLGPSVNRWSLLVNDLCRQASVTQKFVLNSHGLQQRNFITVSDVVSCCLHFLDFPSSSLSNFVFNLGDRSCTVYEMALRVSTRWLLITGNELPLIRSQSPPLITPSELIYDNQLLKDSGFKFSSNINSQIDSTIHFCLDNFKSES